MRTIILSFAIIFCITKYASSQSIAHYNSVTEKIIAESDFIFEGDVVEGSNFIDTTLHKLYRSDVIKITKIISGNNLIKTGTIEVIDDLEDVAVDPKFGIYYIPKNHHNAAIDMPGKGRGIYFGKQAPSSINNPNVYISKGDDYKPSKGTIKTFDNTITVIVSAATDLNLKKYFEQGSSKVAFIGIRAFGKDFKTKEEYYQFLSKYPNITIPKDTTNEK